MVNLEANKTGNTEEINTLKIDGNTISDRQEIANAFNKYFLTVAENINMKQKAPCSHSLDNTTPIQFLTQSLKHPFPNMNLKSASTKEIEKIIKAFIHSVFCLTTGPKPPPKRCLHIVRCRASSFK